MGLIVDLLKLIVITVLFLSGAAVITFIIELIGFTLALIFTILFIVLMAKGLERWL